MRRKNWRGFAIVVAIGAVMAGLNYWLPTYVLPYMLLSHQNLPVEDQPKVLAEFGAKAETIRFQSRDKTPIEGWWIPTQTPNQSPILIVLHNLGGTRQDHLARMLPLWKKGINLLLLDLREHGGSGGEYFTYGYHEWQDIAGAIDELEKRQGKLSQPIVTLGISAGGAVALAAAAQDQRIDGVITIGTFADLAETIAQQSPWLLSSWRQRAMAAAEKLGQFEIAAASPRQVIARLKVPVLIAHGEQDDYIPFANAQQLFVAAHQPKRFYAIANANHADMLEKGGEDLNQAIVAFLQATRFATFP